MNSTELRSAAHRALRVSHPAVLLGAARTLRVALGAVLVAQFLYPAVLPPLFTSWVVPWLGAPPAALTRTSYLLGLAPWVLLAAMQVVHARLLRRAGFSIDAAEVVWMTIVPVYNVAGTVRLFTATGRALVALGAPAGLLRDLGRSALASVALGVAVPLEWVYVLGSGGAPLVGTELFLAAFLLLAARLYLLARLHSAFAAEPVRSALLAPPEGDADADASTSTTTTRVAFTPPSPPARSRSRLRSVGRLVAVAVLLAAGVLVGLRIRRDPVEEARRADEAVSGRALAHEADRLRASPEASAPPGAAAAPQPPPGAPEPAAVALPARIAAPGAALPELPEPLYGGRTAPWWEERIALLRRGLGEDAQRLADLTVARARANGLAVQESAGSVRVTAPGGAGGRP